MKKIFIAILVLSSTILAQAGEMTLVSTNLNDSFGTNKIVTKFQINTEMKETFAKIEVEDATMSYIQVCPGTGPSYPYPYPYPGNYCRTFPEVKIRTIFSETVKIEGMTMNGDDVIFQGQNGDVVCGKMGFSRILKKPTFFLSGKCSIVGDIKFINGKKNLTVKFITK